METNKLNRCYLNTPFPFLFLHYLYTVVLSQQNCQYTTTSEGTTLLTSGFNFLQPFVPSFHDTWSFKVKADANVYLKLSAETYDTVSVHNTGEVYVIGKQAHDQFYDRFASNEILYFFVYKGQKQVGKITPNSATL